MSTVHHLSGSRPSPSNEVVIALHCSASSGRQWDAYTKLLPPGMRLIAPDLMGYGPNESWASGTPVSLEAEATRLAPVLTAAAPVHLVGHSYGAAVALEIALLWPGLVKSLTLFEPVRMGMLLKDPEHEAIGRSMVSIGRQIGWQALSGRTAEAAEVFIDYWSGTGTWQALPETRRRAVQERMHKVRAEFEALFADDVEAEAYRSLRMPMHLIAGTRSPLPGRTVVDHIARQCPQAKVVRLPGVGHMGPISHASMVAAHLAFQKHPVPLALAA
jgi:pimeloyl-ACP methyl ester carboxylesterase